ncbi:MULTISPECIES: hypothetical protein [unclassified Colwellia]|nr:MULTISPECIES: hypothetical protein [unclassified Colwellia]
MARELEKTGSNLLGYIFVVMLSLPTYGGNSKGTDWQWLDH